MKESNRHNPKSFLSKTRIVLFLLGILPFILVIYLFYYEKIQLTDQIVLFSALALFSILTGFMLLRTTSDQLIHLSKKTKMARKGDGNGHISIEADQELIDIASDFNSLLKKLDGVDREVKEQSVKIMKYALDLSETYQKLQREEKLRDRMSRYVGENLVEKLINSKELAFPEDERKEVAVLFADIRSFTSIAENIDAQNVITMLNEFFDSVVDICFQNHGILDKFLGDQLMAVFGLIKPEGNASRDAVQSAIDMQDATEALMTVRNKQNKPTFEIGIGINTGLVVVGNVGSKNRMDYTVIGDSVNVAARLQQIATGGEIIIGERTYLQIKDGFRMIKKGEISVKNKTEPLICYHVLR
jgi:class 3 adenylate cyclase